MRKTWIFIEFDKKNLIKRVELYGSVQKMIEDEEITDNGKKLNQRQLYGRLQKSVTCKATENRMFESDNFSIIERKIQRAKMKRHELLNKNPKK